MTAAAAFTIRHYRPGDETGILELFNEVFRVGNPDFVPRTESLWRWQFADGPCGHQTMVAEAEGRIVGQYTAIPNRWRFPHGIALGAQALDSCVAEGYRRSLKKAGLFLTLGHEWFDYWASPERDNIVYGFPNPQAFRIGTRRLHYRPVHCPLPRHRLDVRAAAALAAPAIGVRRIDELDREVDVWEAYLADRMGIACVRDAAYLNWRYARCPAASYRLLRAESAGGALRGFLVYRLGWHGDRKDIAPVLDWLIEPGDRDTWRALLGVVGRDARDAGLQELYTWVPPGHPHRSDLEALGFLSGESRFNLCIRIFCDSFDVAEATRSWYVVMGDSDIY